MFVEELLPEPTAYIEYFGDIWKNENENKNECVDKLS